MSWQLDIVGYQHSHKDNTFVAIIPVWSDYAKEYKLRPINHLKITGVGIINYDLCKFEHQEWHPDNLFGEKWIQVRLTHVTRSVENGNYFYTVRTNLSYEDRWLYFVPAKQLVPLHYSSPLVYKSKDREAEEEKIYEQAWAEMGSNAIMNNYI